MKKNISSIYWLFFRAKEHFWCIIYVQLVQYKHDKNALKHKIKYNELNETNDMNVHCVWQMCSNIRTGLFGVNQNPFQGDHWWQTIGNKQLFGNIMWTWKSVWNINHQYSIVQINFYCETTQTNPKFQKIRIWSNLIKFGQIWSNLIKIWPNHQIWSNLIKFHFLNISKKIFFQKI